MIVELCRKGLHGGLTADAPPIDVEEAFRYIGSREFYDSFLTHLHEKREKHTRRKKRGGNSG